jgi:hypothetical protein
VVQIQLTESYGPFVGTVPVNSRTGTGAGLIPRQGDFWKDFQVHIHSGEQPVLISASRGHADYGCNEYGGCSLIGATLEFDLSSDSARIMLDPPEGEQVTSSISPACASQLA